MPLQTLAPDQRAVVQLVLQRERSYGQIAELLSISEDAVRARAHAGLSALAPDVELPADKRAQVADFLLGQQTGKPRQATRRMLRSSNGAREWAEAVRAQLVEVGGASVPELPPKAAAKDKAAEEAPAAEQAQPRRRPRPRSRPRRRRRPRPRTYSGRPRGGGSPVSRPFPTDAEPAPDPPAPRPRPLRNNPRARSGRRPDDRRAGPRRRRGGLLTASAGRC